MSGSIWWQWHHKGSLQSPLPAGSHACTGRGRGRLTRELRPLHGRDTVLVLLPAVSEKLHRRGPQVPDLLPQLLHNKTLG